MNLTTNELLLLIEALTLAASRHESYSRRFNPRAAGPHDRKAEAMRQLKLKLMKVQVEIAA